MLLLSTISEQINTKILVLKNYIVAKRTFCQDIQVNNFRKIIMMLGCLNNFR